MMSLNFLAKGSRDILIQVVCANKHINKKNNIPKGNGGLIAKTLYQVTPHSCLTFATNV